jgi:hypothetical protein
LGQGFGQVRGTSNRGRCRSDDRLGQLPQAVTARVLVAQTRQRGTDCGKPQWTGVELRPCVSHTRVGHLPARTAQPSRPPLQRLQLEMASVTPGWATCPPGRRGPAGHHSKGCNLKCMVATVDQHASEPGNTPAGGRRLRATAAQTVGGQPEAFTARPRPADQWARPGPGHFMVRDQIPGPTGW